MEPLIDRMAGCEPKRTALLLKIMERPAMYFGTARFDYMDHFLFGYDFEQYERDLRKKRRNPRRKFYNDIRFTMEYWLLHTQSATYQGSLTGWSLFARCFGCGQEALDAYRAYLCSCFPPDVTSVEYELYEYEDKHKVQRPWLEDNMTPEQHEKNAEAAMESIQDILRRAKLMYDQLKVYIRRDACFFQVRFKFRSENGWTDDSALIMNPDNHDLLIAIHAHVRNTNEAALKQYGFDVFDTQDESDDQLARRDLPYELSFASDYAKWKNTILNEA